jgi:hypothetical protein
MILAETIERVRALTREENTALVVADDGSTDGTADMLRDLGVAVAGGQNRGVAWNKNRALFVLSQMLACETVILLEDDTRPAAPGWETEWIAAAKRWGHVNAAMPWIRHHAISGSGSAADPLVSPHTTAQCASWSREALTFAGYMDTRFTGFGHEHVEHSFRMVRSGYGGCVMHLDGEDKVMFYAIDAGLDPVPAATHGTEETKARNAALATEVFCDRSFRAAWRDEHEMYIFRDEAAAALRNGEAAFRLVPRRPPPAAPGVIVGGIFATFPGPR